MNQFHKIVQVDYINRGECIFQTKHIKMMVIAHHISCSSSDGTIHKFVVIWISMNETIGSRTTRILIQLVKIHFVDFI